MCKHYIGVNSSNGKQKSENKKLILIHYENVKKNNIMCDFTADSSLFYIISKRN